MSHPERFTFRSEALRLGAMPRFSQQDIARERPLRFAPIPWARAHAGPIVRAFLDALPQERLDGPDVAVRAKVSYLRAGWSATGLRWHLDSTFPRDHWPDQRPDFWRLCAHLGGIAATRVAEGEVVLPTYAFGVHESVWGAHVDAQLAAGTLRARTIEEGELFELGAGSIHSVAPAERDGFRVFLDVNLCTPWNTIRPRPMSYDEAFNSYYPANEAERLAMVEGFGAEWAM